MMRPLILALAVSAFTFSIACDKKTNKPSATPKKTIPDPPVKRSAPAPKGVPQVLKDMIDANWSKIEAEGDLFLEEFARASKAKAINDRAAMDKSIDAANEHFKKAIDMWNEIAYWPTNNLDDDMQRERSERYLAKWDRKTKVWMKKNKALKEFSRIK